MSSKMTRFETLLEAVPDALVGMDQKGVIRFVNHQTESLFGYDRDQLISEPIEKLLPEPLWQIYAQHREGYFTDPRTRSSGLELELSGRHRDGTEFPVNISLSHIDTGDVLLVVTAVRDVTQQKQAVKNAQLIAAIVESSEDAIIGSTPKGVITSWNPAAERMYGYPHEAIIGRSAKVLIPEDLFGERDAVLDRVNDGQTVEHLETTRVRKDGTVVPVSITVAPIRDEGGLIVGASEVHRDVTEQRRAFEAAQRMAAIVEYSDDAIIGITLDGIVRSWNTAAEVLFGYSREEIIGTSVEAVSPRDRPDELKVILAKITAGEHIAHLETIRVRRDETLFPVSLTVSAIRDERGMVVGASMISRDMTELKHAAEYSRSLIEASLDPLVTISAEGKIDDVNGATVRVTGVSRDELIGTDFSQYFTEPDKAHEGYERVFAQGSLTDYPLTLRHRDGTLTDVLYNASVYRDFRGEVVGVLATARDVTELKHAAEYARSLIEAGPDPLVTISPEGSINDVNEAAVRATGVARDKLIGTDFSGYFTDPDKAHQGYDRAFLEGAVTDFPLTLRHLDGTLTDVLYNAVVYRDTSGKVLGVLAAARGIARR